MTPAEIIRNFVARPRTAAEILQDEITRHNAEVDRRRLAKKAEKAAKALGIGTKAAS